MLLGHDEASDLEPDRRRELLLMASQNVDRLSEAIVWLEERLDLLTGTQAIRLPSEKSSEETSPRRGPRI